MVKILGIDRERCIKCEKCVEVCTVLLFSVEQNEETMEKSIVFSDSLKRCFRCGHCIAICPTEAIPYEDADAPYNFEEASNPEKILSFDDLMKLVRSRRSIRKYENKPVPREKIESILEAMRYAPSASNRQGRKYIVITDQNKIKELSKKVANMIAKTKKYFKLRYLVIPFTKGVIRKRLLNPKTKKSMVMFLEETAKGRDLIFFHAPCVIILYAPKYSQMTGPDAGIAITHGMFAAQVLRLGTCWIGFAQEYLWRSKKTRKKLGIPKWCNVYGVMIVGYPTLKFERAPPRRQLKAQWLE